MQELENNLPMDDKYKNKNIKLKTPIRVIEQIYSSGDIGGPKAIAFCFPLDERVVREHGSKLTLLKNISAAKHKLIMKPIGDICICKDQADLNNFDAFFTHTLCHECCHSIGPHDLPNTTVRKALEECFCPLEEAKADIVGLWATQYLIDANLLPKSLEDSIYVSFVAGAIRSIRFGIHEAHGKGLALQFNYLLENDGILFDSNEKKFRVDFTKIKAVVEKLANIILTIQAEGDKNKAIELFNSYVKIPEILQHCLDQLQQVPVDIFPEFPLTKM